MQIEPTLILINEEIRQQKKQLREIIDDIWALIQERETKYGRRSGIILVSDGFFEALHHMDVLRNELVQIRKDHRH